MAYWRWLIAGLLVAAVATLVLVRGCESTPAADGREMVTIRGETFRLEVAADRDSIQRGMMERPSIDDDGGMLFIFPNAGVRDFWMGHCLVDIDIAFLDPLGYVTATHRMKVEDPQRPGETDYEYELRMPRYSSRLPAQFAIELKAGSLERLGIEVGSHIDLDVARLKKLSRRSDVE